MCLFLIFTESVTDCLYHNFKNIHIFLININGNGIIILLFFIFLKPLLYNGKRWKFKYIKYSDFDSSLSSYYKKIL